MTDVNAISNTLLVECNCCILMIDCWTLLTSFIPPKNNILTLLLLWLLLSVVAVISPPTVVVVVVVLLVELLLWRLGFMIRLVLPVVVLLLLLQLRWIFTSLQSPLLRRFRNHRLYPPRFVSLRNVDDDDDDKAILFVNVRMV